MEIARNSQPDSSSERFRLSDTISETYKKIQVRPTYSFFLLILGFPVHLFTFFYYLLKINKAGSNSIREQVQQEMLERGFYDELVERYTLQLERKNAFFDQSATTKQIRETAESWAKAASVEKQEELVRLRLTEIGHEQRTYHQTFQDLVHNPLFLALSFLPGILMYTLILMYSNPYTKYVMERFVMTLFVIMGVVIIVFTLLYMSPFDPAANILGEGATKEQIANFNHIYGLDQGYFTQLWNNIKGIAMFDLGTSYTGNEDVASSIARKFPITLTLTLISLFFSVLIAIPVGIISATRPNSFFDYTFMFIALLGLSIPNFWQGLIFILNFSIKLGWFPATFSPENAASIIMPVIVLGTGLTAAVARMTRSSTLEVIHEDYIITAKAKGLSRRVVLWRHAVGNAIIPIITVIGLQFGGMLGGAAVTEKVFNISGIGSYIVDKQFIPDIPGILGGVVYTAITISIVNVFIDILYAFFDPRIRSKMKQY
ncbi:ABC transporter permease [Paenibacillus sp. Marseille-Q4541]|uniref:ABC transporter permease n=1 Tax=Paenibacillus sp. Marseille-Q4541 TaxID=2831522 RepID=UPI001BA6BC5A|nr:ABC transporter permease [Paenibacillus sp. Marseille-Q4541]